MLRRQIRQGNILLQERSRRPARHVSDLRSRFVQNVVTVARDASFHHFEPDQGLLYALRLRLFQCAFANKFCFSILMNRSKPASHTLMVSEISCPYNGSFPSSRNVLRAPKPHASTPNSLPTSNS